MSYRVVIADDERKVLQLIRALGNWEKYDIEIVDECGDGHSTLESILKHRPDFVLSDIKMPGLDGIELIEETRKAGVDSLFILISGYRHFEYARSAIALNVVDYLLKPVDEEQLNKTLEKVCRQLEELREARANRAEVSRMKEEYNESRLARFWNDLFADEGRFVRNTCSEAVCNEEYQTAFREGCYQMMGLVTNTNGLLEHSNSLFSDQMMHFLDKCFGDHTVYYARRIYAGYLFVLNYPEAYQKQVREGFSAFYYCIRNLNEVYGEFRLNIGISSVKKSCRELLTAQREARAAEWGRLIIARDGILDYSQVVSMPRINISNLISSQEQKTLESCIRYFRREELGELFSELHRRAVSYGNSFPGDMAELFFCMTGLITAAVPKENSTALTERCFSAYIDARNFPQMMKLLYLRLEEYIQEEQKKLQNKVGKPISEAVRFIRANYNKPISAEEVAEASRVSPAYLSKLFREEMDVGFNEFLTQVRMEEAQHLLESTNLPVKEIAGSVGYPDEKYFSKLFKKTTGVKPTEYRRIYG